MSIGLTSVYSVPSAQLAECFIPRLQMPSVIRGKVRECPVFQTVFFKRTENFTFMEKQNVSGKVT